MNRIHPKKLRNSKWTAVEPVNREKHFLVTEVEYDEEQNVVACTLQAVLSKRETAIDWRELTDRSRWRQGWE
ncbi:TIGR02450 family Trp-rich protein [Wenzhouxiangella sp. XN79A]|uniref:TIGR02450 family Trp-rich protein n=1 Tax=Wenzhouxiangella sp. XN79A TaxID=2724193 RepID=UPI00144A9CB0|nr:TIGR02450 family Trp-rich protein [Wenzhouxiangella sp. XN79A]NKI35768.1 TIGR02450 family Trp-rich protein [Wenzhouxiangella sp. XN79A]